MLLSLICATAMKNNSKHLLSAYGLHSAKCCILIISLNPHQNPIW